MPPDNGTRGEQGWSSSSRVSAPARSAAAKTTPFGAASGSPTTRAGRPSRQDTAAKRAATCGASLLGRKVWHPGSADQHVNQPAELVGTQPPQQLLHGIDV